MSNTVGNYSIYAQSMNGIITLSDGVIQIQDGDISNVQTIDADMITGNSGNFDNVVLNENLDISGNLTIEKTCNIKGNLILDNPVNFTNATVDYLQVENDLLVTNKMAVGDEIISSNDIKTCSNIICKNISINGDMRCDGEFIYKNQPAFLLCDLGIPFLKSLSNIQSVYSNLNLQTYLGNTGNNRNILVYPFYKIIFRGELGIIRQTIDNTNNSDMLYQTVTYPTGGLCVSITVLYKNIVII